MPPTAERAALGAEEAGSGKRARRIPTHWRPGLESAEPTSRELIRDFLLATEELSREEVCRIAGVGPITLSKWERGLFRNVQARIRRRVGGYLRRQASSTL